MDKRKIAKRAVAIVAAYGAGTVTKSVIANNVQTDNILVKIPVVVASNVLAGLVGMVAGAEAERRMDEMYAAYDEMTLKFKEAKAQTA
jgi:L-asparaginase/Glu-tRNA(Gln) amidotransferase subunit D